jgi:hypothetical protein
MALNWGAISVGGIAGIGSAVIFAIPVLLVAGTDGLGSQALLILAGFLGQIVAGFVGGILAGRDWALHGGMAALLTYLVTAGIAVATGQEPSIATLLLSGVVALVLGSAGGVLAQTRSRPV